MSTEIAAATTAIGLAVPSAPTVIAYWVTLDPSVPLAYVESSITFPGEAELPRRIVRLDQEIGRRARAIQERLMNVKQKTTAALRVAITRRHQAMCRANAVDAAIDVGIALESLFLNDVGSDDRGEMAFRIQVRAARFLGSTPAERLAIRNLVRTAYRMRSAAAHTGVLNEPFDKQPVSTILAESYALLGRAIIRVIEDDSFPDWNTIVLD